MKYCTKCGARLDDEANFCVHCGTPTAPREEKPALPPPTIPSSVVKKETSSTTRHYCPNCGSSSLQTIVKSNVEITGKNYSAAKGCCGAYLFGPIGALCGSCGQGTKTKISNASMFACNDCGHEFVKRDELVKAVEDAERLKKLAILLPVCLLVLMYIPAVIVLRNFETRFVIVPILAMLIFSVFDFLFAGLWYVVLRVGTNKRYKNTKAALEDYDRVQHNWQTKHHA